MLKSIQKNDVWSLKLNGQTIVSSRALRPFVSQRIPSQASAASEPDGAASSATESVALTDVAAAPDHKKNEMLFSQGEHQLALSWEELLGGKGARMQFSSSEACGYRYALPFIQGEAVYGLSAYETKAGYSSLPVFCTDQGRLIVFEPNCKGELKILRHRYYFTFDSCPSSLSVFLFDDTEELLQNFSQALPGRDPDFHMVYSGSGTAKPVFLF